MDNDILNMFRNYFETLENVGNVKDSVRNNLIVLDFINEFVKLPENVAYLEDDDIAYINKYVNCFNNCLN